MEELLDRWRDRIDEPAILVLDIEEQAVSKERPRMGKHGSVYTPKRTRAFEKKIAEQATQSVSAPVTYPIKLTVTLWETPPKTWPQEKRVLALAGLIVPTRGDLDNQVKAITDGLNGIAYIDDVQITRIDANRLYGTRDRILVTMSQMALSPVQVDHAVASLKTYLRANVNGQRHADKGGAKMGE